MNPAFPAISIEQRGDPSYNSPTKVYHTGMSLRDYFAAVALQGHIASDTEEFHCNPEQHAVFAYKCADAMLERRTKSTPQREQEVKL